MNRKAELPEDWYFYNLSDDEIWSRYCGFLDLSIDEFMAIQRRLLKEQIDSMYDSFLGRKIIGDRKPENEEEFRRMVPFTTYKDYEPYLSDQREDVLPEKPHAWTHTSGRGGSFKWIPYTTRALDTGCQNLLGIYLLSAADSKGEVKIRPNQRSLWMVAPPPYLSGSILRHLTGYRFSSRVIPPPDIGDKLEFQERVSLAFEMAMREGVDMIFGIGSVLAKVGQMMSGGSRSSKVSPKMLHPAVIGRLGKGLIKARLARRAMRPADIWPVKGILTGGTDTSIYKNQILGYWGCLPTEVYAGTEGFVYATASWNKRWLTFFPQSVFLEFIPEAERRKEEESPGYVPTTILMHQVQPGQDYEVVLTQFYNMPLMRYRLFDLVHCIAAADETSGVTLPQFVFKSRVGDIIKLLGLTEIDEKLLWNAIVNTGVEVEDWTARTELEGSTNVLRIYAEPKDGVAVDDFGKAVDAQLYKLDVDYRDIGDQLGINPVRATLLAPGSFKNYYETKRREGADLAHLKPPHMNAHSSVIDVLLKSSDRRVN